MRLRILFVTLQNTNTYHDTGVLQAATPAMLAARWLVAVAMRAVLAGA